MQRSPGTPIGSKLDQTLRPYLQQIREGRSSGKLPKPRNYIILTDGHPGDGKRLVSLLRETGATLNAYDCPREQLGLQFVQIGDDEGATAFLESLDNGAEHFHRVSHSS